MQFENHPRRTPNSRATRELGTHARHLGTFGMTKAAKPVHDPRATSRKQIDDLLKQRQRMLVLLWELTKVDLNRVDETIQDMLDEFLTILVDYIAIGHFGLYQRISDGNERRSRVIDMAKEIYPRIERATESAIAFSERFEGASEKTMNTDLAPALSHLAEQITTRIELEDLLISAVLGTDTPANAATN